jgi:pimeloyl-ACP methyl ester carboxylesterase
VEVLSYLKHVKRAFQRRHVSIVLVLAATLSVGVDQAQAATKIVTAVNPVIPVLFLHGYSSATPQGLNATSTWSGARSMLANNGFPLTDTLPVSYYKSDTNGVDITGSGPGTAYPAKVSASHPRKGYNHTDGIEPIAHDLAWFLYDTYGDRPVDLVGHSMGGLIIRYALQQVEVGNPAFPPAVRVHLAVTFAAPFDGANLGCKDTQCLEMAPGSGFLTALDVNTPTSTQWVAVTSGRALVGGAYCDVVHTESATDIAGILIVYSDPCYQHLGYLTDMSTQLIAKGTGPTGGRRSLNMLAWLFTASGYGS